LILKRRLQAVLRSQAPPENATQTDSGRIETMAFARRPFAPLLILFALIFALASPAHAGPGDYLRARGNDLRDAFILDLGRGHGFAEIDLRATDYATFCVGFAESYRCRVLGKWPLAPVEGARVGDLKGRAFPRRHEANVGFPFTTLLGFMYDWRSAACTWVAAPEFPDLHEDLNFWVDNWLIVDDAAHVKPWSSKFDVAGGFTIPFVAVRVGLSGGEFVDLFAGLFGLDPAGDDER
jgi:hypothetical protein